MNKITKIFICILALAWVAVIGSNLVEYNTQRKAGTTSTVPPTSDALPQNVTAVIATVPYSQATSESTSASVQSETQQKNLSETDTTAENRPDDVMDNEKIVTIFNDAMNNTKTIQRTCNVTTVSTVNITVTDCSVPAALNTINSIIQRFSADNKTEQMLFKNGVSEDGLTILSQLPPMGKTTSLTADGVASAVCEPLGDGYKLTITIVPETASLEQPPLHHSSSIGYLDAASLDVPATITQADMVYPGATITICTNADGLMNSYERTYPMSGSGTAKVGPLSGSASFEGSLEDKWTFEWA